MKWLTLAALVLVATSGSAGAAVQSSATLPNVLSLRPGDQILFSGTTLACGVSAASPRTVVCAIAAGNVERPKALTYAIAATEGRVALLQSSATQTPQLVHVASEPTLTGDVFPLPSRTAATTITVGPGGALLTVGGTHVFCQVPPSASSTDGPAIACGVGAPGDAPTFAASSYVAVLAEKHAGLEHVQGPNLFTPALARLQPTG